MATDRYEEPLVGRYTSNDMQYIFSQDFKFQTWRKCWMALAEAQKELDLRCADGDSRITDEMIAEMRAAQKSIDYDVAKAKEREIRHDVMAHVYEFGTHCPTAKGIIHLGATSMFPCDHTELIQMREGMDLVKTGLVNVINNMALIAEKYKDLVTLGFTHYQPAQPTTVGKRMTLYIQDLLMDLASVESIEFVARGAKGTTGTQASFLELFGGDYERVRKLDRLVSGKLGFERVYPVTAQTYPRKFDSKVVEALAGIGVSLYKFGLDMRLLSNRKEVDEPFQAKQTGSSAMPYKRNPMRSERLCAIARKLTGLVGNFYHTAAAQMLERTLDDSSIRSMDIPQAFLCADAILILANNITNQDVDPEKGRPLTFYADRIRRNMNEELPFMATEAILMDLVKQGQDRQEMHELIKKHSVAAGLAIKEEGRENDLFERLAADDQFPLGGKDLQVYLDNPERFAGCAERQTEEFLKYVVKPVLDENKDLLGKADSKVNV